MFANAYQNGPTLQVWDAKVNVDKNQFYKQLFKIVPNYPARYFDKDVKSYLYLLQGQNAKMSLPADESKLLSLHQRFLVLHVFVPLGFAWSVELAMTDINGIKRRINITTTQGKQEIKYFSFRYPIDNLKKGVWLFLAIDVFSFMQVFKDQTFRSLDQIIISSSCRLRRIFTMKEFLEYEIPKNYWLSQGIPQQFQIIQFQTKPTLVSSKQLTESVSPKKLDNSSNSLKKEFSPKMANKSQIDSRKNIAGKRNNLLKSEVIIENARNRIENLTKQEEILINKSKQLQPSSMIKMVKQKNIFKIEQTKQKVRQSQMRSKVLDKTQKAPQIKTSMKNQQKPIKNSKLPLIQKSFKQDIALNVEYEQSSNFTQQHMKTPIPTPPSQGPIQQDHWSQDEQQPSRPISEAISNITGNFPSTVITKENNKEIVMSKGAKKELELIYDEMVGCYYHPETNNYYELKH